MLGIFEPCDIKFPTEPSAAPKNGSILLMGPSDNCDVRYTPDLDFVGLDSFDYILRIRNICAGSYCGQGEGKIWTMNNAYYGPTGATVTVSSKNVVFSTVTDLVNGNDFFINGKNLPNSNSNWTFNFYYDGVVSGTPDFTADVHTSCSALIFGVDFGIFSPIAGCVATQSDKANCSEAEINAMSGAQYRAINDYTVTEILDTTKVYVVIVEGGLLPIDFGLITGRAKGKDNYITWNINTVIGEEKLILQKADDGQTFENLTYFTDLVPGNFDYTDSNVSKKVTYYRFKVVSFNGDITYSRAISIENNKVTNTDISIYPLPASDDINYDADIKISQIKIYNLHGQLLHVQHYDAKSVRLNPKQIGLNPGAYFSNILLENGTSISKKISIIE